MTGDTNSKAEIQPLNSQTDTGGSLAAPKTQEDSETANNGPFLKKAAARKAIEESGLSSVHIGKLLKAMQINGWNRARKDGKEYVLACKMVQRQLLLSGIEELAASCSGHEVHLSTEGILVKLLKKKTIVQVEQESVHSKV